MKHLLFSAILSTLFSLINAQTWIQPTNLHMCYTGTTVVTPAVVIPPGVSGATSYSWGIQSSICTPTSIPTTQNGSTALLSFPCVGVYTVSCDAYNSSSIIASASTTAEVDPPDILLINASSTIGCQGDSFTLSATGSLIYSWAPITAIGGTVVTNPVVSTCYTVTSTNAAGCQTTVSKCVVISPNPTIVVSPSQTICCGASATLNVSGANTYTWNNLTTTTSIVVSPQVSTCYTVSGTSTAGCIASNTVCVIVTTNSTLAVSSIYTLQNQVSLFPNPANKQLTLQSDLNEPVIFSIYDITGRKLIDGEFVNSIILDISNFYRGTYFVIIRSGSPTKSGKFIIGD